ncbi:MAG: hypothetical protein KAH22_02750 [Thiotrichaceae bacterium]|nr:hypothetical protein [Thiotrichaceae bacterium]
MFLRMLLICVFTLFCWQIYQTQQNNRQLKNDIGLVKVSLQESQQLQSLGISLDTIKDYIAQLKTKQKKSFDATITVTKNELVLYKAYYCINLAENLAQQEKRTQAAEKILSCKDGIWKSSDNFPKSQAILRGLMAPIDGLAQQWKNNKQDKTSLEIKQKIGSILTSLGK